MPLRKRIGIMGVGCWSALRGSNPPLCAMLAQRAAHAPSAQ